MARGVGAFLSGAVFVGVAVFAARPDEPGSPARVGEPDATSAAPVGPLEAFSLPPGLVFQQVEISAESAQVTAGEEKLIYSNTLGNVAVSIGTVLVSDDLATTSGGGCTLRRIEFPVIGKVNPLGLGGPYAVTFGMYSTCPGAVPFNPPGANVLIPGTSGQISFTDDGPRVVSFDLPGAGVALPSQNVWFGVRFSRTNAGVLMGAPADIGFSNDQLDFPGFPCNGWLGGFPARPHASIQLNLFGDPTCAEAFAGYRNHKPAGNPFNPGAGTWLVDDIELGEPACRLIAYEVAVRGAGFYEFDMRSACDGGVLSGSEKSSINPSGTERKILRFVVDPPVDLSQRLWFAARVSQLSSGVLVTGVRAGVGATEDSFGVFDGLTCNLMDATPGAGEHSATDLSITCAGQPPVGACCDMIFTDEEGNPICRDALPEMNCPPALADLGPRRSWVSGEECTGAAFLPSCGTGACCVAGGGCETVTRTECELLGGIFDVKALCDACGSPCSAPPGLCGASGTLACSVTDLGTCSADGFPCAVDGDCTEGQTCRYPAGCADCVCCREVCVSEPSCCSEPGWSPECAQLAAQTCEPFNDRCVEAKEIHAGQPVSERTVDLGRTAESYGDSFCCDEFWSYGEPAATVWYRFTATAESARLHTCDTDVVGGDSILQVYEVGDSSSPVNACASLTAIGCNDDAEVGSSCAGSVSGASDACVPGLTIGGTYYVMLAAHRRSEDAGIYTISIQMPCPYAPQANDSCEAPEALSGFAPSSMVYLEGASLSCPAATCTSAIGDSDVWFTYTPPVTGDLSGSFFVPGPDCNGTNISLYGGCECPADPLAELRCTSSECYPEGSPFPHPPYLNHVEQGACYLVRVQGAGLTASDPGRLVLCLEPADEGDLPKDYRDCDNNGVADACDAAMGAADCDGDGWLDQCEISYEFSQDCNANQTPDDCELALGAHPDCNLDGEIDACDIADGSSTDCNANGVPDECDLAGGALADDDGDGIPTECEPDCQPNGVIDDIDIGSGTSADCNDDGRPDECGAADHCDLARFIPWGPWAYPGFGAGLAVDGERVLIGAPGANFGVGEAFLYRRTAHGWARVTKFLPPPGAGGSAEFGTSVALTGNLAVVGAPGANCGGNMYCGAVFVYVYDGFRWSFQERLVPSNVEGTFGFGVSVAADGDRILVVSWGDDGVFVFARHESGWREESFLRAPYADAVALSNDRAMVGISGEGATLFRSDAKGWVHEGDLAVPGASMRAFSLSGDVAVIGAANAGNGAVSVFRNLDGAWTLDQVLSNPFPNDVWDFGAAASIAGNRIVIGAPTSNFLPGCYGSGRAFVYTYDGIVWTQLGFVCNRDQAYLPSGFGTTIASGDSLVAIGATAGYSGDAYALEWRGPDCDEDMVPDACGIAFGESDDCDANGIPDICPCGVQNFPGATAGAIPTGCGADCQTNGTPDYLDIGSGASRDCNLDGVPDECGSYALTYSIRTHIDDTDEEPYQAIALADLDSDGRTDFFAATEFYDYWYLNDGLGGFRRVIVDHTTAGVTSALRYDVDVGDLDGDTDLDVVFPVVDPNDDDGAVLVGLTQQVLLHFNPPRVRMSYNLLDPNGEDGGRPHASRLTDIDGDNDLDLVACYGHFYVRVEGKVAVLFNDGAANFTPGPTVPVGWTPRQVALVDLDGDDDMDAVVPNQESADLSVLLNSGTTNPWHGFTPEIRVDLAASSESQPFRAAAADFDLDGDQDVVVALANQPAVVTLLNQGNGPGGWLGFAGPVAWPIPFHSLYIIARDLDRDGWPELIAAQQDDRSLVALGNLGRTEGGIWRGFSAAAASPAGAGPVWIETLDLDGDQRDELLVVNRGFESAGYGDLGDSSITIHERDRLSRFQDDFPVEFQLDTMKWPVNSGAEVYRFPVGPHQPYELLLDDVDIVESRTIDLSRDSAGELRFYLTRSPYPPEDRLHVEFQAGGTWHTLMEIPPGDDRDFEGQEIMTLFRAELPPEAFHSMFRLRLRRAPELSTEWALDDLMLSVAPQDCDGDAVLDGCEIADKPALDRNTNRALDVCDLDLDGDGDVDLRDAGAMFACFGVEVVGDGPCAAMDFHANERIDLADIAGLASTLTGPR